MRKAQVFLCIFFISIVLIFLSVNYISFQHPFYFFKGKIIVERTHLLSDEDRDGVFDLEDILDGARKEIRNHPRYKSEYYIGGYPPEDEGVCTDVIWRSLSNAGFDLKQLLDADIAANSSQYPWVQGKPDPNIDFRRVRNQLVFFRKYATSLTLDVKPYDEENLVQWQAGDIVVLEKTDHIAIISDKRRRDGVPYIIHNSSTYPKEENRLMKWYKKRRIVAHFRFPKGEAVEIS